MTLVSLVANGRPVKADVEPRTHLADFLRESHNLTGTHLGCEHGVCGACTVLIDGQPARSCIAYAASCENAEVTTIEGLDHDEITTELRAAFTREHALQCGFCTPGMVVSARDVVIRLPEASEREVRIAMSGNLCRCTGYVGIVRAILSVIEDRRARGVAAIPGGGRERLGPVGAGHGPVVEAERRTAPSRPRAPAGAATEAAPAIEADFAPQQSFDQSFVVGHPPEIVWDFFGRLDEVAECLPGAALDGAPENGRVQGRIRVKVGPMSADFGGVAEVTRDEAARSGRIVGAGRDRRSNSTTRGLVAYRLMPEDDGRATRVALSVGYTLTGMLAQFGRSGMVKDVAGRLIAAFVANLEARLAGGARGEAVATELDAGSLVWTSIAARLKALWASLFGRKS